MQIVKFEKDELNKKVIAMATDNNYVKYMYVAITSLMYYNKNIKLYVITIENLTESNKKLLEKLNNLFDTLELIKVTMEDLFNGLMYPEHVSKSTFARLYIPNVVKESKCLMLDIDIIINDSLDDLFDMDISNYYIAGRKHLGRYLRTATKEDCSKYGIPDFSSYINIGVMMMNLELMRKDGIDKKLLLEIKSKSIPEADQGIYNKVCYNKIKFIPAKYNWSSTMIDYPDCYGEIEIKESIAKPVVIHYIDNKPWNYLNKQYASKWWKFAKKTELYEEFCREVVEYSFAPKFYNVGSMDFVEQFVEFLLSKGNIIIYGAGKNGHVLLDMMKICGRHPVFFAVSSIENIETPYIDGVQVECIDNLVKYKDNTVVIISIADMNERKKIEEKLAELEFEYYIVPENYINVYLNKVGDIKNERVLTNKNMGI